MASRSIKIRRSQLITPFGIGSIIDLPDQAVMPLGLENWETNQETRISDDRLAKRLNVNEFHQPIPAVNKASYDSNENRFKGIVPVTRFPLWHFCPSCRAMKKAAIFHHSAPTCEACTSKSSGQSRRAQAGKKMVPVRFAVACSDGHIDDFPWAWWAHGCSDSCESPSLKLLQTNGAGLSGLKVVCNSADCSSRGKGQTLQKAGNPEFLEKNLPCSGNRPWLGNEKGLHEACNSVPRLIQRGSSNTYFADIKTSILIPPFSEQYFQALDSSLFSNAINNFGLEDGVPNPAIFKFVAQQLGLSAEKLEAAYHKKQDQISNSNRSEEMTEEAFRLAEYEVLKGDASQLKDDLRICQKNLHNLEGELQQAIDSLVAVEKLVETRCLTGFRRLDPNEGRLAKLSATHIPWLPAIRGTGEGIFIELNKELLSQWSQRDDVKNRISQMRHNMHRYDLAQPKSTENLTPQFVLLHTLAHCLSTRLSFEAGYGSSSIRERLYSSEEHSMNGLMLYTSEAGSEGTLGGLVLAAEPDAFSSLLYGALDDAIHCSNDPLCEESTGQGPGAINLAACQGCTLIPETSCEEANFFLDRVLLIGNAEHPELGFFSNLF